MYFHQKLPGPLIGTIASLWPGIRENPLITSSIDTTAKVSSTEMYMYTMYQGTNISMYTYKQHWMIFTYFGISQWWSSSEILWSTDKGFSSGTVRAPGDRAVHSSRSSSSWQWTPPQTSPHSHAAVHLLKTRYTCRLECMKIAGKIAGKISL